MWESSRRERVELHLASTGCGKQSLTSPIGLMSLLASRYQICMSDSTGQMKVLIWRQLRDLAFPKGISRCGKEPTVTPTSKGDPGCMVLWCLLSREVAISGAGPLTTMLCSAMLGASCPGDWRGPGLALGRRQPPVAWRTNSRTRRDESSGASRPQQSRPRGRLGDGTDGARV